MENESPLRVPGPRGPALLFSLAAGVLNIAAFPRIDLGWLAFAGLLPIFLLLERRTNGQLFRDFWLAAFVFRLGNLYWIIFVIGHYTQLHIALSIGVVVLLCIFMALFWGLTGWLLGRITRAAGLSIALLAAPFLWVAQEYAVNILQFPWDLLGYSQYAHLRIAQIATFTGVYGLSWVLAAFNAGLALWILRRKLYYICSITIVLCVAAAYGQWRISQPVGAESARVGVVQGNVPQDEKIDYRFADDVNRRHIHMTEELVARDHPDIVFWSESSTLYPIQAGGVWTTQVVEMVRRLGVPLYVGSDLYKGDRVFNSSFLIYGNGAFHPQEYSKIYLVPFGEYVPLSRLFFFAGKVVPEISDFTAGYKYTLFPLKGKKFAVNICFEVVFPQLARTLCGDGSALLTTITNDAWFGKSCAPHQHFAMAVMRAIENRRYLVRAANTGISGVVDPYGRILVKTGLFVPAEFTEEVRFVDESTFYTRHGDVLVHVSLFVFIVMFLTPWGKVQRRLRGTGSETVV
ncbi:MAG TPA: apolipoprotein N-acyltransferase [Acidobacteriota bacterium]|nr:apolipoprotein N-acyltransferase [Acidobacteriota bacterium]